MISRLDLEQQNESLQVLPKNWSKTSVKGAAARRGLYDTQSVSQNGNAFE